MKHFAFPDIQQFRQVIRNVSIRSHFVGLDANGEPVYDSNKPMPVLKYHGTQKLHGTNSAICLGSETGEISLQSREQIITLEKDNAGFARFCSGIDLDKLFSMVEVLAPMPNGLLMQNDEEEDCRGHGNDIISGGITAAPG